MKVLVLLSALVCAPDGPNVWAGIDKFLSQSFGFSRPELTAVRDGQAVVRALPSSDDREITSAGVILVHVAPGEYVEQLRDITLFKRNEMVRQIGTFGVQPAVQDVDRLTLPDGDRRDLARCRPARCEV